MKKSLFLGALASMMLLATSCQEDFPVVDAGGEGLVSFEIETPQIATRAYSDGLSATDLQYAVYEVVGENQLKHLELDGTATFSNRTAEVKLQLTNGVTYTVVFWAQATGAPYTVNFAESTATMVVDYKGIECNNENLDAFFAQETFKVEGNRAKDVKLKRPFAQLNIGTSDFNQAVAAGYTVANSAVKVSAKVYNTLDLVSGKVTNEQAVEFASAAIPNGEAFPVDPDNNKYLAMNYLLVGADKAVIPSVTFTYSEENGNNPQTRTYGQIPVQRNYRTNIFGSLLTNTMDVTVTIDRLYENEYNNDYLPIRNNTKEKSYNNLRDAIEDADENDVIEIDGGNYDLSEPGQFDEKGPHGYYLKIDKSVTIQGLEGSQVRLFTSHKANEKDGANWSLQNLVTVVAPNVTLKNLTFEANFNEYYQGPNKLIETANEASQFNIIDCVLTAQEGSTDGGALWLDGNNLTATVDGCTFENVAISVRANSNATINDCKFDGIRETEGWNCSLSARGTATVNNATFTNCPESTEVVNAKGDGVIYLNNSTFPGEVTKYYAEYDYGKVYVDAKVFNITTGKVYSNIREAVDAAAENDVIEVLGGDYDLGEPGQADQQGPNGYYLMFDTKGVTLKAREGENVKIFTSHNADGGAWSLQNLITVKAENVTLEGITFEANYSNFYQGPNKILEAYEGAANDLTLRNCTFKAQESSTNGGSVWVGGDNGETVKATIEGCTFQNSAISVRVKGNATINDCKFDGIRETEGWNCSLSARGKATANKVEFKNCPVSNDVVNARGDGFIMLNDATFPGDAASYYAEYDNGVVIVNGQYFSGGGSGTAEDPYLLSTARDILLLGKLYDSGNHGDIYRTTMRMTTDIDISDTPIRNLGVYSILLDGAGYTLTVNLTDEGTIGHSSYVGLFANFNGAGNEYIYETTNTSSPYAYTVQYGPNKGKTYEIKAGCVRNLVIDGTITNGSETRQGTATQVAPLGGQSTGYYINVTNKADIYNNNPNAWVAGIVTYTKGTGLILDCTNEGDIVTNSYDVPVGGIAAQQYGGSACNGGYPDILGNVDRPYAASTYNCHNKGNITSNSKDLGGIIGQTHGYGGARCISYCTNTGNLSGRLHVGGIIARHTDTGGTLMLENNTNSGTLTASEGNDYVGNIIGVNNGTLFDDSQTND